MNLSSLYEYLQLLNANQRAFFHSHYTVKEKKKKKDMLLLYNLLLKQNKYDENSIKSNFKDKNLSRLVRRLFDIIEDYMLLFDKQVDRYSEIFNFVIKAKKQKEIGMLERAEFLLLKAKKISEEVEDVNYLTIVLKELSEVYIVTSNFIALENLQKIINKNLKQTTKELNQYFMLVNMRIKLRRFMADNLNLNVNANSVFNEKEFELLMNEEDVLNSECLEKKLFLKRNYFTLINENKKAYEYQLKSIDFYETKGLKKRLNNANFTRYNLLLYNKFRNETRNLNFEDAELTKLKFIALEKEKNYFTNNRIVAIYKIRKANMQLFFFNAVKKFDEIIKLETESINTISNYKIFVPVTQIFTIQYFTGFAFFTQKNYNKASDYFKLLLDDKNIKQRKHIETVAAMQYLICVYELNKSNFAKSVVNSVSRIIKQNAPNVKCYLLIIELINKLLKPLITSAEEKLIKKKYLENVFVNNKSIEKEEELLKEIGLLYWIK